MSDIDRWVRMGRLAEIDLDAMSIRLKALEDELASTHQQLECLTDFYRQSSETVSQPSSYRSVQDIQRQVIFIESLQTAMHQQEMLIVERNRHIDQVRHQVLALYQKKESYYILAQEARIVQAKQDNKKEDDVLDDLAQYTKPV